MKKLFFAAALAALCAAPAAAFHPLVTEDLCYLGLDGRQIETALEHKVERAGADLYATGASAELSYGLFRRFDVLVTVPWQGWTSHGVSESGLGDVLVEAKFPAGAAAGWEFAMKPGFSLPAGDEARSLGAGKGGVWLYGIAGRTEGPRQYYFNAGYRFNNNALSQEKHIFKASAAAALELLPATLLSAELSVQTSPEKESASHPAAALFGLTWTPHPALDLSAGVSFGLTRSAEDLGLLGGLVWRI